MRSCRRKRPPRSLLQEEAFAVSPARGLKRLSRRPQVWDTFGNTLGIVLRRMMAGDTPTEAFAAWESSIFPVTLLEFKFWPIWQSVNFLWVKPEHRVLFCAVGSFLWNGYLSFVGGKKQGTQTPRGY